MKPEILKKAIQLQKEIDELEEIREMCIRDSFINCVAWRGSADFLGNYAHKGDTVGVEGRIQTRNYDRDGQKVYVTEIIANSVSILHSTQPRQAQAQTQPQQKAQTQNTAATQANDPIEDYLNGYSDINSDELPF